MLLEVEGYAAARLGVEELGALLRGPAGSVARVVVLKQPPSTPPPVAAAAAAASPRPLLPSSAALFSSPRSSSSSLLPMIPVRAAATVPSSRAGPSSNALPTPPQQPPPPPPLLALDLERRPIPQPPVKTAPLSSPKGRSVAYIRLHYFARDATRALAGALLGAEARGDEGIVLDLRNNPGGVFEEALADAAMFLRRGERIASTTRTPATPASLSSSSSPPRPPPPVATFVAGDLDGESSPTFLRRAALSSAPMAVLVDAGSASGAEVLAGALADNGRAALVGPRRTFGKGLIQYYFLVDDGRGGDSSGGRKKNSSNYSGVGGGIKVTGKWKRERVSRLLSSASSFSPAPPPKKKKKKKNSCRLLHAKGPRPVGGAGPRAATLVLGPRQRPAGQQLLGLHRCRRRRCRRRSLLVLGSRGGRGRRRLPARGPAGRGRRDRPGRRGRRRGGARSLLKQTERERKEKPVNSKKTSTLLRKISLIHYQENPVIHYLLYEQAKADTLILSALFVAARNDL